MSASSSSGWSTLPNISSMSVASPTSSSESSQYSGRRSGATAISEARSSIARASCIRTEEGLRVDLGIITSILILCLSIRLLAANRFAAMESRFV